MPAKKGFRWGYAREEGSAAEHAAEVDCRRAYGKACEATRVQLGERLPFGHNGGTVYEHLPRTARECTSAAMDLAPAAQEG